MTRTFQHFLSVGFQIIQSMLSKGPVHIARLTETAAAYTASLNFQNNSVLSYLNKRNNRFFQVSGIIHIHYQLFGNPFLCVRIIGNKPVNGSILLVSYIIKGRDIDSLNFSGHFQKITAASAFFLIFLVTVH